VAGRYPFPLSDIKDQLPFRRCLVDILEEGSLITRARCPLWKLPHKTGDDQREMVDKEITVGIHTQTEEHCYCRHLGYLFSHWGKKRERSSTQNVLNFLEEPMYFHWPQGEPHLLV